MYIAHSPYGVQTQHTLNVGGNYKTDKNEKHEIK